MSWISSFFKWFKREPEITYFNRWNETAEDENGPLFYWEGWSGYDDAQEINPDRGTKNPHEH